jgi:hypothetical protein
MIISNDIYLIFDMIDFPKWIKISDDIFTNRQCRYKPDKFHDLHIDSPNLYTWKCKYSYEIALEKTLKEFNITRDKYETTKQFYESDEVDYLKKFTISFIRHGPRTPLKYCVDNYYDETPCGEITKLG